MHRIWPLGMCTRTWISHCIRLDQSVNWQSNIFYLLSQVQTDFQQVGESQFLINIPEADHINHIVIFLTGTTPLPAGMAGSVYFSWPDPSAPPSWLLLGYISNNKPSAIFKISQLKKQDDRQMNAGGMLNVFGSQPISHIAQIGVSIEPESTVAQMTPVAVSFFTNRNTNSRWKQHF